MIGSKSVVKLIDWFKVYCKIDYKELNDRDKECFVCFIDVETGFDCSVEPYLLHQSFLIFCPFVTLGINCIWGLCQESYLLSYLPHNVFLHSSFGKCILLLRLLLCINMLNILINI